MSPADRALDAPPIEAGAQESAREREALRRGWIVPAIIGSALLMQTLEATVMSNALPTIARTLRVDPLRLNMTMTMFLLASAVCLPVSGWMADKLGAKKVFMTSMVLFALSSAGCGFAHNLPELIVGRIFQGVAASMMAPVGRLVLLRTTPKSELVGAMSVLTMPALIGPVIGPILGGTIVTFFNWRWIFYINLPVALLGVALVRAFVPDVKEQAVSPLDWRGIILTGVGLGALIFGFENLGRDLMPPGGIVGLFVLAAACLGLYWRHARGNPHAIIDLSIFRIQTFQTGVVAGGFFRIAMGSTPFLLAMLLQVGFGMSALRAGLMTFIAAAGALVMKPTVPRILGWFGFKRVLSWNALICGGTFILCAFFRPDTPHWLIMVVLGIGGFFRSLQFTSLNGLTFADVDQARMSRASTTSTMAQQLVQSVGIGLAATFIHFLTLAHHETQLTWDSVAPVFAIVGGVSFVSLIWYVRLPRNAGSELHGRRGRRGRA